MTSCDRKLLKYLPIQIVSMMAAMPDAEIDFYLFHRDMEEKDWAETDAVCRASGRIRLHPVRIREPEKYDKIAIDGGGWSGEAYYSLCAWQYLPDTMDRILYVDAGDILFVEDIAPYYNAPFHDKLLLVTPTLYKIAWIRTANGRKACVYLPCVEEDWDEYQKAICQMPCLFNSGSYVINLERMRSAGLTIDDYAGFAAQLRGTLPVASGHDGHIGREVRHFFWEGDEGFMSAAFLGDLQPFEPENEIDIWYRPYNFTPLYYKYKWEEPYYQPAVVHFAGIAIPKPWNLPYVEPLPRFSLSAKSGAHFVSPPAFDLMKKWYQLWYSTAKQTDVLLTRLGF